MDDEKQLGINIRELRKLRLLTQAEQAERAGFSLQHVGDIERGKANPTLSCLLKLAGVPLIHQEMASFDPKLKIPCRWDFFCNIPRPIPNPHPQNFPIALFLGHAWPLLRFSPWDVGWARILKKSL